MAGIENSGGVEMEDRGRKELTVHVPAKLGVGDEEPRMWVRTLE